MVRSHWMGPAVLVLAAVGWALGQGVPGDPHRGGQPETFVAVQEIGRPPQRCRILKSWRQPDGSKAYQVQAADTGEMITLLESNAGDVAPQPGGKGKAVASRIVHWGMAHHPPPGTPDAPPDAVVYGGAAVPAYASVPARPARVGEPAASTVQKPAPGAGPEVYALAEPAKVKPVQQTLAAPAAPASQVKPTPAPAATVSAPPAPHAPGVTASAPPATPAKASTVVVPPSPPAAGPSALPAAASPYAPVAVKSGTPAKADGPAVAKAAEGAKPVGSDWHLSWGKVEQPRSALLTSAAPPSAAPTTTVKAAAAPRKTDPLRDPESYLKESTEERIARKSGEKITKGAQTSTADATAKSAVRPASAVKAAEPTTRRPAQGTGQQVAMKVEQKPAPVTLIELPFVIPPPPPKPQPAPRPAVKTPPPDARPAVKTSPPPAPVVTTTLAPVAPPPVRPAPRVVETPPPPPARPVVRSPEPPPPASRFAEDSLPAYMKAAAVAAADESGNAFSSPRRSPPKPAGPQNFAAPPPVQNVPGYGAAPGAGNAFTQIPAPPPVIAAAPSAAVVAAGFPVAALPPPAPLPRMADDEIPGTGALLTTLRGSLYPSQREWAADRLTACDWRSNPQVVDALATTARNDPAPLVRAGCLRALGRMGATSEPAVNAARDLRSDADARVRQEAENTLGVMQTVRPVRLRD